MIDVMNNTPRIVVAVCTRNRVAMLKNCLSSIISAKKKALHPVDLLVIDNSDSPEMIAATAAVCSAEAEVIVEKQVGIPFARNRALEYACRGNYDALIFLDDDQTITENWISDIVKIWIKRNADVVKSAIKWEFSLPSRYQKYFKNDKVGKTALYEETRNLATNGVLISKGVFSRLRFLTTFPLLGGTDSKYFDQAGDLGYRQIITYEIEATEICPPQQLTFRWLLKRRFRVGAANALLRLRKRGPLYYGPMGALRFFTYSLRAIVNLLLLKNPESNLLSAAKAAGMFCGAIGLGIQEYKQVTGS